MKVILEFFKNIGIGIYEFSYEILSGLFIFSLSTAFRLLCILGYLTNIYIYAPHFKTAGFWEHIFYLSGVFFIPLGILYGWVDLIIAAFNHPLTLKAIYESIF